MLNVHTIRKIYLTVAMIITALIAGYMLINDDNMNEIGTQRIFLMRAIYCVVWVVCVFWYVKDVYLIPISTRDNPYRIATIKWFVMFVIITCISLYFTHVGDMKELIANCILFVCPCLTLIGSYAYTRRFGDKSHIIWMVVLIISVCVCAYVSVYSMYNVLGVRGYFATAYYPLYLLPVVLACDKRWIHYVAILVISIVIFTSLKRGGLVALVLGLSAYIIIHQYLKQNKITFVLRTVVVLIITFVLGYIGILYFGDTLLERLLDRDDTTGSGRTEIWLSLYTNLVNQDTFSWLIGNGHLSTVSDSYLNRSAHNDFLEIIYNYGAISLIMYLGFIISIIKYTLRCIRQHSKYAASLAMLITIYLALSMVSIIVLFHTFTLALLGFGLLIGWNEYESQQQRSKEHNSLPSAA